MGGALPDASHVPDASRLPDASHVPGRSVDGPAAAGRADR